VHSKRRKFLSICSSWFQAMEFLFNLLRCIPGGGIFLWFAKVHSKRVESSFFYWNLFQLAIMAFQGAQLLYIPYPITGHWAVPCTPIGDETWGEVITSCLHWSEHMWLGECHKPCPVKGQATTCLAPLHNWLCLVADSSCRVTDLSLTASVAQLHSVTWQLSIVT